MTLPEPTHRVIVQHTVTRAMAVFQCCSFAEAEIYLSVYESHGWSGSIEEIAP